MNEVSGDKPLLNVLNVRVVSKAKRVPVSVALPEDVKERIDEYVRRNGTPSRSEFIVDAILAYLNAQTGPSPDGVDMEYVRELEGGLARAVGELEVLRVKYASVVRRADAVTALSRKLLREVDYLTRELVKAKVAVNKVHTKAQAVLIKKAELARMERELKEELARVNELERKVKALQKHVDKREQELLEREKYWRIKRLGVELPRIVLETMERRNIAAIGAREVIEYLDPFFSEAEVERVIRTWPIIGEGDKSVIRDAGAVEYQHFKHRITQGVFKRKITFLAPEDLTTRVIKVDDPYKIDKTGRRYPR